MESPAHPNPPQAPPPSMDAGRSFEPMFYVRVLRRRRWLILGIVATVVGLAAVWTLRKPKIYQASASMIIDVSAPKFLDSQQVQDVVENGTGNFWNTRE